VHVRNFLFLACLLLACNGDSSNDGGTDATTEQPFDICATFTSAGQSCDHASNVVCFKDPNCNLPNGCSCKASDAGPTWVCTTPPECIAPCGNTSPLSDAACDAEAGDDADVDAGDDAGDAADGD
jgi:hypothetical protein